MDVLENFLVFLQKDYERRKRERFNTPEWNMNLDEIRSLLSREKVRETCEIEFVECPYSDINYLVMKTLYNEQIPKLSLNQAIKEAQKILEENTQEILTIHSMFLKNNMVLEVSRDPINGVRVMLVKDLETSRFLKGDLFQIKKSEKLPLSKKEYSPHNGFAFHN